MHFINNALFKEAKYFKRLDLLLKRIYVWPKINFTSLGPHVFPVIDDCFWLFRCLVACCFIYFWARYGLNSRVSNMLTATLPVPLPLDTSVSRCVLLPIGQQYHLSSISIFQILLRMKTHTENWKNSNSNCSTKNIKKPKSWLSFMTAERTNELCRVLPQVVNDDGLSIQSRL